MAKYNDKERKAMERTNRENMQHITSENLVELSEELSNMESQLAEERLNTFKYFVGDLKDVCQHYINVANVLLTDSRHLDDESIGAHKQVIKDYESMLTDNITFEQKMIIMSKISEEAKAIDSINADAKKHHSNILKIVGAFLLSIGAGVGVYLGTKQDDKTDDDEANHV